MDKNKSRYQIPAQAGACGQVKWMCRVLIASVGLLFAVLSHGATFYAENFGAVGDGKANDTNAINHFLAKCSDVAYSRCELKAGRSYRIRKPLFLWGKTTLASSKGGRARLIFDVDSSPYLLNVGLSSFHHPATPYGGAIRDIDFEIAGGKSGRLIYFWRADGATIANNNFELGHYDYSATSSGNDNRWLLNSKKWVVRKNLVIRNNRIVAESDNIGSEGFGFVGFQGITIENNEVTGVGDDPIGIHDCELVTIRKNRLRSNDGRILVNNSALVDISDNRVERMVPASDGKAYSGIALIYVGYESYAPGSLVRQRPPQTISISGNVLVYPERSTDKGAAIYVYGAIDARILNNEIVNESDELEASAIHVLPAREKGGALASSSKTSGIYNGMVRGVKIEGNRAESKIPLTVKMTGNCSEYDGTVEVTGNRARNFEFYCDFVKQNQNALVPYSK